ncbi:hypothetical protein Tco_0830522 [Tanacetum coccineum]
MHPSTSMTSPSKQPSRLQVVDYLFLSPFLKPRPPKQPSKHFIGLKRLIDSSARLRDSDKGIGRRLGEVRRGDTFRATLSQLAESGVLHKLCHARGNNCEKSREYYRFSLEGLDHRSDMDIIVVSVSVRKIILKFFCLTRRSFTYSSVASSISLLVSPATYRVRGIAEEMRRASVSEFVCGTWRVVSSYTVMYMSSDYTTTTDFSERGEYEEVDRHNRQRHGSHVSYRVRVAEVSGLAQGEGELGEEYWEGSLNITVITEGMCYEMDRYGGGEEGVGELLGLLYSTFHHNLSGILGCLTLSVDVLRVLGMSGGYIREQRYWVCGVFIKDRVVDTRLALIGRDLCLHYTCLLIAEWDHRLE